MNACITQKDREDDTIQNIVSDHLFSSWSITYFVLAETLLIVFLPVALLSE